MNRKGQKRAAFSSDSFPSPANRCAGRGRNVQLGPGHPQGEPTAPHGSVPLAFSPLPARVDLTNITMGLPQGTATPLNPKSGTFPGHVPPMVAFPRLTLHAHLLTQAASLPQGWHAVVRNGPMAQKHPSCCNFSVVKCTRSLSLGSMLDYISQAPLALITTSLHRASCIRERLLCINRVRISSPDLTSNMILVYFISKSGYSWLK